MLSKIWHLLASTILYLLYCLIIDVDPLAISKKQAFPISLFLIAYLLSSYLLSVNSNKFALNTISKFSPLLILISAVFFLLLMLGDYSRQALILAIVFIPCALYLWHFHEKIRIHTTYILLFVTVSLSLFLAIDKRSSKSSVENKSVSYHSASNYNLKITKYKGIVPIPLNRGGGIGEIGNNLILVTGDGDIYLITKNEENDLVPDKLTISAPVNLSDFKEDAIDGTDFSRFRVGDILVIEDGEKFKLLVTHHRWRKKQQCFGVRVSFIEAAKSDLNSNTIKEQWQTLYDTKPCLKLRTYTKPFSGHMFGGRIVRIEKNKLLLSVGDHGYDGWYSQPPYPQLESSDYGKILAIDLITGESSVFSSGHRNPQGLAVAETGEIWETEHGPQGGDELNLIKSGQNYGWPYASYGTDYGAKVWPLNHSQNGHGTFTEPMFSWTPSIAPSNLIVLRGQMFPDWKGDLLLAHFKKSGLQRVHIANNRAIMIEPLALESRNRIRDIIQSKNGSIIAWLDNGSIITMEKSLLDDDKSDTALWARCAGCHSIADGKTHGVGPDLLGVFNKPVASKKGYSYSRSLMSLKGVWNRERLDKFLQDPSLFAPGTTMLFHGIKDVDVRKQLIDYIEKNTKK